MSIDTSKLRAMELDTTDRANDIVNDRRNWIPPIREDGTRRIRIEHQRWDRHS